jgi:hypothetical protein
VAGDAQDGGVDGQEISERAREQGQQSAESGNQGQADERRPAGIPDGQPTDLPTPEDRPGPDDHPGTSSGGPPDVLPDGAEGRAPVPPIPS